MKRREFMEKLEDLLADLSSQDRQEALDYYNSYMDDAGIGLEDEIPEGMDMPEEAAKELKRSILNPDVDFMADEEKPKKTPGPYMRGFEKKNGKGKHLDNGTIALIIVIAVVTSPIWFSIIAAVGGALTGVVAALFGLLLAGVVLFGVGAGLGVYGISLVITNTAAGFGLLSAGCILVALGILFVVGIVNVMAVFVPWMVQSIRKLWKKFFCKGGKEA